MVRQSGSSQGRGQRANQDFFFSWGGELCFFFSGDLASLLQEFDWIGSSNRQQKIGSSPEKTKPLQVLATFRWNVLPSGLAFCLSGCAAGHCLSAHSPLIAVAAGAGPETSRQA